MKTLAPSQLEIIKKNLNTYLHHFKPITIEYNMYDKGFYVYQEGRDSYIQYCYDIHYLNGWLYGAVQSECGVIERNGNN